MTKNEIAEYTNSMPFVNWLTILFIGLRLTDNIDWSWYYIGMPFFVGVVLRGLGEYIRIKNEGK